MRNTPRQMQLGAEVLLVGTRRLARRHRIGSGRRRSQSRDSIRSTLCALRARSSPWRRRARAGAATRGAAQTPPTRRGAAASAAPAAAAVERRLLEAVRRNPDSFDAHHALGEFYLQARQARRPPSRTSSAPRRSIRPTTPTATTWPSPSSRPDKLDAARAAGRGGCSRQGHRRAATTCSATSRRAPATSPPRPRSISAPRTWTPTEEHLFDWGNNLLQLRAYDDAVEVFTRQHPPPSRRRRGCTSASASRSTRAASTRTP